MGGGLSKLGTALIAVFAVCFLILVADLLYVLWRRRRFQRRSLASASEQVLDRDSSSLYVLSSKELLYFFCGKNQSARIEPNESRVININDPDHHRHQQLRDHDRDQAEIDVDHVTKIHDNGEGMYQNGPSRLLFTIKEEEESECQRSSDGLDHFDVDELTKSTTVMSVDDLAATAVTVRVELDDATPFSTPCGSPLYYTPSPSPSREELKLSTMVLESYGVDADREKVSFVSLELMGV